MEKLEKKIEEIIDELAFPSKEIASEMAKTHIAFALWLEKERLSIEYSTPNEQYQLFDSFITNYYK